MTAITLDTTAPKLGRHTDQPVRRKSRPLAAADAWFRPMSKNQVIETIRAAREWSDSQARLKGRRWGPLTPIDLKVLETLLFKAMDWATGRLDWSYLQIAAAVRRSKQTIADSLARLRTHGFLDWIRRFEPTGQAGFGPQVKQATNAYRVSLPAKVRAWFEARQLWRRGPLPVDFEAAKADRMAELKGYLAMDFADRHPAFTRAWRDAERKEQERES